jgi:hypothetical protein
VAAAGELVVGVARSAIAGERQRLRLQPRELAPGKKRYGRRSSEDT